MRWVFTPGSPPWGDTRYDYPGIDIVNTATLTLSQYRNLFQLENRDAASQIAPVGTLMCRAMLDGREMILTWIPTRGAPVALPDPWYGAGPL